MPQEAYKLKYSDLLREKVRNSTKGLFASKGFRETLMGLLTPREEQIAIYLKVPPPPLNAPQSSPLQGADHHLPQGGGPRPPHAPQTSRPPPCNNHPRSPPARRARRGR